MRRQELKAVLAIAASASIPLFPMAFHEQAYLVWPGADVSDLLTAHVPISTFIHQALNRWGQIPLWNPTILSGMPVMGDPLAGLAYPPLWLTYWLPSVWTYHFLLWLHLSWAGIGMYFFARALNLRRFPALASGVALALAPRLLAQWGLGHATLVFSFCWTPWLLLALHRSIHTSGSTTHTHWYRWAIFGGCLGILASADPRWGPPAGILAAAYGMYQFGKRTGRSAWRSFLAGAAASLAALLGSLAFMAIPLLQLLVNSQRASISIESLEASAMPGAAFFQLLIPNPTVWPEWGASVGTGILLLALISLAQARRVWFWWGVIVFSVLLSLGPATPVWGWVTSVIPGLEQLRMPGRWFLLASLAFPLLAGYGLQTLSPSVAINRLRRINLMAVGAGGLVIMLAVARWLALGSFRSLAAQAAVISALVAVFFIPLILVRGLKQRASVGLFVLIMVELAFLDVAGLEVRSVNKGIPAALRAALPSTYGLGRIFSTSHGISQLSAVNLNLEMANGVHPFQLQTYHQYMADAVGFDPTLYSVVLPPLSDGGSATDAEFTLDLEKLRLLNLTHIVAANPLQLEGLNAEGKVAGQWIYSVEEPRPRAWVQPIDAGPRIEWREVDLEVWSPNRIELTAVGPGRLVLSELQYPSWAVTVDGSAVEQAPFEDLFRSVTLPAGEHYVVFQARPGWAFVGLLVTVISWLIIGLLWWKR